MSPNALDKKTINKIKKQLRNATRFWSLKNDIIKESRVRVRIGTYKTGNPKFKTQRKCAGCGELHNRDNVNVDHIREVGAFLGCWNRFILRLYCDKSNLQVLCKPCHDEKTEKYNWLRREL